MIPAIAEFFKTTLDAGLSKLVQPSAVVPATVFVLLNALLIHPPLLAAGFGPAAGLDGLPDVMKVAVVIAIILLLGYVLLSLNATTLRLATGELWRGSILYGRLLDRAKRRRAALSAELEAAYQAKDSSEIQWLSFELKRWPSDAQITPTRLGNAIASTATTLYDRYGIDMTACWPPLQPLVAKESTALATLIDDARGSVDLLLNLALVFVAFGLEGLLVQSVIGNFQGAAYALLAIPVAYGCYRAASARALGWGNLIETAFDLHRDLLATELGLRKSTDFEDGKGLWKAASRFLLYTDEPPGPIFDEVKTEKAVTVTSSANLEVAQDFATEVLEQTPPSGGASHVAIRVWRTNFFNITAKRPKGSGPVAGHVHVLDMDSPVLVAPPAAATVGGWIGSLRPEVIPGSKPLTRSELLWHVRLSSPANALPLRYDLPLAAITIDISPEGWTVALDKSWDPRTATVEMTLNGPAGAPAQPPPDPNVALTVAWSRWTNVGVARLRIGKGRYLTPTETAGDHATWRFAAGSGTKIRLSSVEERS